MVKPTPHESRTANVAIVDEREIFRDGLAMQLDAVGGIRVVARSDRCEQLQSVAESHSIHVALVESDPVEWDVFGSIRRLRERVDGIRVVLMVARVRDALIARAQNANIDGMVTQYDSLNTVVSAIRAAMVDRRMFSQRVSKRLVSIGRNMRAETAFPARLTAREFEVMHHLVGGRTVKQTAAELGVAPQTVDNHKTRLMRKLGVHTGIQLTRYAIREGLVIP